MTFEEVLCFSFWFIFTFPFAQFSNEHTHNVRQPKIQTMKITAGSTTLIILVMKVAAKALHQKLDYQIILKSQEDFDSKLSWRWGNNILRAASLTPWNGLISSNWFVRLCCRVSDTLGRVPLVTTAAVPMPISKVARSRCQGKYLVNYQYLMGSRLRLLFPEVQQMRWNLSP